MEELSMKPKSPGGEKEEVNTFLMSRVDNTYAWDE